MLVLTGVRNTDDRLFILQIVRHMKRWFGPLPGSREARAISWMALTVAVVLCSLSIFNGFQGRPFMGRALGGDFVQFYVAGRILNEYEPARLYDRNLEAGLQRDYDPATSRERMLAFANAPYLALLFRPFATIPYPSAYVIWLACSLALYVAGMLMLFSAVKLRSEHRTIALLLGVSSVPFILETWIGGQVSVIGFFLISLFAYCRSRGLSFLAGFALSLTIFKPTIVVIPAAMLVVGRRWRMLGGLVTGVIAMASLSLAAVGLEGCLAWLDTLRFYRELTASSGLARAKYMDTGNFFHLLLGFPASAQAVATVINLAAYSSLALAWWRSKSWGKDSRHLLWAATFAGLAVFNVYTPVYDTVLIGAAAVMIAGVLQDSAGEVREAFQAWLVLLYMVPWVTQSAADLLHFQPFTLVLAGFAGWTLVQAYKDKRPRACEAELPAVPLAKTV